MSSDTGYSDIGIIRGESLLSDDVRYEAVTAVIEG